MFGTLGDTSSAVQSLFTSMDNGVEDMEKLAKDAGSGLEKMKTTLDTSASLLTETAEKVNQAAEKLDTAAQDGNVETLKKCAWKQPGSNQQLCVCAGKNADKSLVSGRKLWISMAPFYSTLSIWVGGIILVAMMKVTASENLKRALAPIEAASDLSGQIPAVPRAGTDPERPDLSGRSVFPWNPV